MRTKPNLRLLIIFQAFLLTGFGLILKDLDDTLGVKLVWFGIAVLVFFILKISVQFITKNPQKKESI